MTFPLNAYFLAFLGAIGASFFALPLWRHWCCRVGMVDDPGHRKIHDSPIPLAGGLAVMTGILAPLFLGFAWLTLFGGQERTGPSVMLDSTSAFLLKYGFGRRALELAGVLAGAVGMLLVGALDDMYELKPLTKFAAQALVAFLVALCGVRVTLFVPNLLFSYAVTVLWVLTVINAFNFMDNMNGLCGGLGFIGAMCFGLVAAVQGQYLVALLCFAAAGALLGFLPHNFPRATAFLGDGGSHLVGFLMAVLGILPHFYTEEQPRHWAVLTPLIVLAVPLLDMAWVVVLRWRMGKPFYVGDTNHVSHRLVRSGLSKARAVMLIWATAAAGNLLVPLLWKLPR